MQPSMCESLEVCQFAAIFDPVAARELGTQTTLSYARKLGEILLLSVAISQQEILHYLLVCQTFSYKDVTIPSREAETQDAFETLLEQLRRESDRKARLNSKANLAWAFWKSEEASDASPAAFLGSASDHPCPLLGRARGSLQHDP